MKEKIFWAPVVAGVVAVSMTFSGCTKSTSTQPQIASSDQKAQDDSKKGKHKESAEEYADTGEHLLMPDSFLEADREFDKALKEDPNNAKALLYKSVTEPMLTLKGYIARIEPLITADQDANAIANLKLNLKSYNMPELEGFSENLAPGQQPFQSYHDVQLFVRSQLLPAILASVDRLNKIDASTPIQLNFTPERVLITPVAKEYQYDYYYSSCTNDNGQWTCYNGDSSGSYEEKAPRNLYFVDQHDLTIMKSSMMGIADSIRVATAYSLQDSEFALRRLKSLSATRRNSHQKLTAQDVVGVFNSYSNLFTLEPDNQLSAIAASTSQALKYGIELANMKATLCDASPNERTIANSLITPICIEADVVDSMRTGVNLLAGPTAVNMGTDSSGNPINVLTDISAVLSNPTKDLKILFPNQFDAQGNPVNYPDATMGGLFPNGDFISQLELTGPTANVKRAVKAVNQAVNAVKNHI